MELCRDRQLKTAHDLLCCIAIAIGCEKSFRLSSQLKAVLIGPSTGISSQVLVELRARRVGMQQNDMADYAETTTWKLLLSWTPETGPISGLG